MLSSDLKLIFCFVFKLNRFKYIFEEIIGHKNVHFSLLEIISLNMPFGRLHKEKFSESDFFFNM